jgi:DegV family protein with EDD domain
MIGLVTDSNAQMPPELVKRYGIVVVPLTVTIDGIEYAEGEDLDADAFYAHFLRGTPHVTTSQPSPGRFLLAYRSLVEAGAEGILSVHIGSELSGTLNAARAAAGRCGVPVHLVDTHTGSFGIALATWEAAEAISAGADAEGAVRAAEALLPRVANVFVVRALDLVIAGGRIRVGRHGDQPEDNHGDELIPILSLRYGDVVVVDRVATMDDAAEAMARQVLAGGWRLRVAVGVADSGAAPLWQALEERLVSQPQVAEVVRYRIGPSVGAHTGPGTAGVFFVAAPS